MASDGTIDSELFMLCDLWPGEPDPRKGLPLDGFTGATHHDVTEAVGLAAGYRLGDKIEVKNLTLGVAGNSRFIYLKLASQHASTLLYRHVVVLHSNALPYQVTNASAGKLGTQKGPAAVALSAMTTGNCGWFWCGGVCPEDFVANLGGTYKTLNPGTVAIGEMTTAVITAAAACGEIGFDVRNAVGEAGVGFALAADTDGA
jgi:hypothetical protein